jgi:hypothetical protein
VKYNSGISLSLLVPETYPESAPSKEGLLRPLPHGESALTDIAVRFVAKGFRKNRDAWCRDAKKLERERI